MRKGTSTRGRAAARAPARCELGLTGMGGGFGFPLPRGIQRPTFMLWRVAAELRQDAEAELRERAGCELRFLTGLAVIEQIPGMSQAEIARRTGVDRTTVADLLADYLAEGLIERGEPGRGFDRAARPSRSPMPAVSVSAS